MRWWSLILVALYIANTAAWSKEDYEIFDLVADLESSEGKGVTFYSFLNITPSATIAEVSKAYRRRSLDLHPDKQLAKLPKRTKKAEQRVHERFARLGTIAGILRDSAARERYDFFYKNGVPKWRGTGYYYSRFRPTLVHVAGFLLVLISLVHYLIQHISYRQEIARMRRYIHEARLLAWGPRLKMQTASKRVRVGGSRIYNEESEEEIVNPGIELVVEGEQTFIVERDTGDEVELREQDVPKPSPLRTPIFRLPFWIYNLTIGRLRQKTASTDVAEEDIADELDAADSISLEGLSNKQKKKLLAKQPHLKETNSAATSGTEDSDANSTPTGATTAAERLRKRKQKKRR